VAVDVADGWFGLTALAPLPTAATAPAGAPAGAPAAAMASGAVGTPAEAPADPATVETGGQRWQLRAARTIATIVLTGYGLLVVVNVLPVGPSGAELLAFVACVAVLVGIQLVHALRDPARWPPWRRAATVGLQGVASILPLLWIGQPWGSMGGFLAGSLLMVLSGPVRWAAYGAVGAAVLALSLVHHDAMGLTAYLTISTLLTGLVVFGISSLAGLVERVDNARSDLARVAVTRERLRMERELQTQLGEHLSTMTSRVEAAFRLLPGSPGRAKVVLAETLDIAHRSVASVRSVASGYRHMSFTAEVDSAVSALGSAGIRVDLSVGTVPRTVDGLLAVVLREAVTNVVRHSAARRCTIAVDVRGKCVELTVTNDGVPPTLGLVVADLREGSGLGDLAERLRAIGGTLAADCTAGAFRVVASVPGADSARDGESR
jgi:signal transduction histidine kinase